MSIDTNGPTARPPLRPWPGVVGVALQWLAWVVVPIVAPEAGLVAFAGTAACALAVVVWWVFFSRAPWLDRLLAPALMVAGVAATSRVVHPSVADGLMGMMLTVYSIPVLCLALVAWAVVGHGLPGPWRRASMAAIILAACGAFTLVRTGGVSGQGDSDLHWRWTPTPEERLLAQASDTLPAPAPSPTTGSTAPAAAEPAAVAVDPTAGPGAAPAAPGEPTSRRAEGLAPSEVPVTRVEGPVPSDPATTRAEGWPGFRGPARDGVARGVRIDPDWSRTPPVELWRKPIGPGWSSFAVAGDLAYTQEQRGDDEVVSCYRLATGEAVWRHRDGVRFWESNAGAGPRATPAVRNGRVYTLGATGIVNALDARTGARVWSRDAAADTSVKVQDWGFSGSPLVLDDLVVVAASGRLVAYDIASGAPRWLGPTGKGGGYSSPHLVTIDGVAQILLLRGGGVTAVAPSDGAVLWEHEWEAGPSIVQPAVTADGGVLLTGGDAMGGIGLRRLEVGRGSGGWTATARWSSRGLKPYFNDFVVHDGHAYGFDGSILSCVDLADGTRKWKGGRYGSGQMVLLPDQDLLLVLSEEGELALVRAAPDKFTEVARAPAIEGKTWNHPVVVGDTVIVRNGETMAAFRLAAEPGH